MKKITNIITLMFFFIDSSFCLGNEKIYSINDIEYSKEKDQFLLKKTNEIANGKVKELFESAAGKVEIQYSLSNGKKQGNELRYLEDGTLLEKTPYIEGKKFGISEGYYTDGKLMEESLFLKGELLNTNEYYQNSKKKSECVYSKDLGYVCTEYFESGNIKREQSVYYYKGKKEEDLTTHEEDGTIIKVHSTDGKFNGQLVSFFSNGQIWKVIPYKNGQNSGVQKEYYRNGKLARELPFKNDKLEGIAKLYTDEGCLAQELPFINNKQNGLSNIYTKKGKICLKIRYKNGKAIGGTNSVGNILTNAEISNSENGLEVGCY